LEERDTKIEEQRRKIQKHENIIEKQRQTIEEQRQKIEPLEEWIAWSRPSWPPNLSKSLDLGQSSTASPDFLARFARLYGSMLYLSARGSLRYRRRIHGHVGNAYAPVVLTPNVSFPALVNFSTPSLLNIQNLLSVCQEARDIALKQYEFCFSTHPRVWMESIWTPHEGGYFENGSRDRKSLSTTILDVLGLPPYHKYHEAVFSPQEFVSDQVKTLYIFEMETMAFELFSAMPILQSWWLRTSRPSPLMKASTTITHFGIPDSKGGMGDLHYLVD